MDGRIFGLDIQLGFDVIFEAIAILIMFVLLSYLLFEPVRKILEDRKKKVAGQLDQAQKDQEEAARLRAEYEGKIKNIEKEADEILTQARKKALKREEEIVQEAKEEAARVETFFASPADYKRRKNENHRNNMERKCFR